MRSEIATLQGWVEALPEDIVRARPLLCIHHAWTLLLNGHPLEAAEARLHEAKEADTAGSFAGELAAFRALIATYQGQTRQSARLAQQALELLPEESLFTRSLIVGFLGVNYLWAGDMMNARRTLDEAARISQKVGNLMNAVLALSHLAEVSMMEGHLYEAQAFYNQAIEMATDKQGRPRPIAGIALIGLGHLLREWNDLERAERHLVQGIELVRRWGEVGSISGYGGLAQLKQTQGDLDGAHQVLQTARQIAESFDAMQIDDILVDAYQVRLWTAQGNHEAAMRWADARGLTRDTSLAELKKRYNGAPLPLIDAIEYTTLVHLYISQNRSEAALQVLEPLLQFAEKAGWTAFVLQMLVYRALALQAQGDTTLALTTLERALALGEPDCFIRTFVDEGQPMAELLRHAASRGITSEYVDKLLAACEVGEYARRNEAPPHAQPPSLVEPLSDRELEVLRLIAAGLSNREIADRLVVAVSTVKTHINNIYRKLDVSKRTQAVARAQELDLL
jgi:LuxR family maltose regulon positive regulatory protein